MVLTVFLTSPVLFEAGYWELMYETLSLIFFALSGLGVRLCGLTKMEVRRFKGDEADCNLSLVTLVTGLRF